MIKRRPLHVFFIEVLRFKAPMGEVDGPGAAFIATGDICKLLNRRYKGTRGNRSAKRFSDCNIKGKNTYFDSRFDSRFDGDRRRGSMPWRARLGAFRPRGRRQGVNELLCRESLEKGAMYELLCYNTVIVCNERI